ncbi:hypothetical protein ACROYT_G000824, partial [Oculina patagonica]
ICLIVGCSRKTGRDKGIRLYRSQLSCDESGPEVEELSIERRRRWISAISRDDLTEKILSNDRVCDQHFHSGAAASSWDRKTEFNIERQMYKCHERRSRVGPSPLLTKENQIPATDEIHTEDQNHGLA